MKKLLKKIKIKRRLIAILAYFHIFGNPSKKLKIIGVTGTNGKTTTTTLLYEVAMALGHKAGLIGTVENKIGEKTVQADHTTPDPKQLYRLLNEMVREGCEYVFMEVSSHALHQNRTAGIKFAGAIFTNLTHDHLDYHENFENYFKAKKKLFSGLSKNAFALSNVDDEYGYKIIKNIKAESYLYGFENNADFNNDSDFKGEIIKKDFTGLEIRVNKSEKIKTKLLGSFNAYNILAVWCAAKLLGFNKEKTLKILEDIDPPRGRFDHFVSKSGVMVVVDYAHSPDSLHKIINAVNEIKPENGRLITVFGCGGDRDMAKRKVMGKIGATFSDIAIFTSDNPRNEDPEKIIDDMKIDLTKEELNKIKTISNRQEAIKESVKIAKEGDIILCAGKGHEDYQEIKGVRNHFNDIEQLRSVLDRYSQSS